MSDLFDDLFDETETIEAQDEPEEGDESYFEEDDDARPDGGPTKDDGQGALFASWGEWWEKHWGDMPEFVLEDQRSYRQIIVHFRNADDVQAFSDLIGQKFTHLTKSIWHPKLQWSKAVNKTWIHDPALEATDDSD